MEVFKTSHLEMKITHFDLRILLQYLAKGVVSQRSMSFCLICAALGLCLTETTAACFSEKSNSNQTWLLFFLVYSSSEETFVLLEYIFLGKKIPNEHFSGGLLLIF